MRRERANREEDTGTGGEDSAEEKMERIRW